ncbi:hypothetical protein CAOG_04999 [Capsaspora owczarzaki ATCC 30864]|nr:hypothetical protein CAOG_04999 [Capsaspora owczarzaki ATCC 30864]KJE94341.1 hypothetical protein CAOG_004999 [Capsaspora owczarzaki ATCC 30864]|eukprot:XP_004346684.1 hypothetical protein CAOG_04999 [Capsaspora owczarzaki ATCC 30864]
MPLPPNPIVKTRKSSKSLSSALPPPLPSPTLTRSTRMRASTDVDAALKPGRQQAAASPTPSGTVHPLSSISAPTPSVTGGNSSLLASPSHGSGVAGNRLSHSSVGSNDSGADGSFGLDDSSEFISRSPRASVVVAPGDRSLASSEDGFGSVSNLSSNNSLGGTPPGSPLLDDVGPGLTRGNTRRKLPFASESATDMRASMRMRRGSLFKNRDNCFFVAHVGFKVFEFEAPTEYDKVVWMKAIGHAIGDQITSLYRGTHEPASASNASSPVASATTTPLLTPQHSSAGLVTAASMISSNGSSLLPSHSTSAIFATTAYASGSPHASTPSPVSVAELHSAPRPASLSSRKDLIEEIFIESNV